LATPHCSICNHPRRHQIELGLVHGTPLRVMAKRFEVSPWAVHRHGRNHLSPQLRAAIMTAQKPRQIDLAALQASEAEGILAQLVVQRGRLQQHCEMALEVGNVGDAVKVERSITANLELVAKLLGQLTQHHEVRHTSVLISADYLQLRQALTRALQPFPAAAMAVGKALHELEAAAAKDITDRKTPLVLEHDAGPLL
jgi:hypothetical protein